MGYWGDMKDDDEGFPPAPPAQPRKPVTVGEVLDVLKPAPGAGGTLLWRCKLCLEIVRGEHVAYAREYLGSLVEKNLRATHQCRHGVLGLLELVGADPDERTANRPENPTVP